MNTIQEETKTVCEHLLDGYRTEEGDKKLDNLMERLGDQLGSDEEPLRKKAVALLRDYLKAPEVVDNVLMDLCGWSLHTLLVFAGLAEDTEGVCCGEGGAV